MSSTYPEKMREAIVSYLPWLLSAITIWMTLLAGNKTRWAWAIGLGNQALWLTWIIASQSWGLIPMTIALTIVYARNHLKWRSDKPLSQKVAQTIVNRISADMAQQIPNPHVKIRGGP